MKEGERNSQGRSGKPQRALSWRPGEGQENGVQRHCWHYCKLQHRAVLSPQGSGKQSSAAFVSIGYVASCTWTQVLAMLFFTFLTLAKFSHFWPCLLSETASACRVPASSQCPINRNSLFLPETMHPSSSVREPARGPGSQGKVSLGQSSLRFRLEMKLSSRLRQARRNQQCKQGQ